MSGRKHDSRHEQIGFTFLPLFQTNKATAAFSFDIGSSATSKLKQNKTFPLWQQQQLTDDGRCFFFLFFLFTLKSLHENIKQMKHVACKSSRWKHIKFIVCGMQYSTVCNNALKGSGIYNMWAYVIPASVIRLHSNIYIYIYIYDHESPGPQLPQVIYSLHTDIISVCSLSLCASVQSEEPPYCHMTVVNSSKPRYILGCWLCKYTKAINTCTHPQPQSLENIR